MQVLLEGPRTPHRHATGTPQAPHRHLTEPAQSLTGTSQSPHRDRTEPHRASQRSQRGPTGIPQRSHRARTEVPRGGGPSPMIPRNAKFPPKCVNSVPPRCPHRAPQKSVRQSVKTEDGLGGEPAHSTPLPTPSLSSMSDSFLKSKFDMGDRLALPCLPWSSRTVGRSSSKAPCGL